MSLKFYTRVAKGLKLKVEKLWGLIRMFVEVTGEKLVGGEGGFLPRFLFTGNFLKITKVLELVSRPQFSSDFLMKNFILQFYINWQNFITRLYLLPKLFNKMFSVIYAWAFDDVMTFEYLKS